MADDRPLEDPAEQTSRLEQDLADLRALFNARISRRPTGDTEITYRATPKDGTLFCQGQVVNRVDYPDLWQWAQDQGVVTGGIGFGPGDGVSTFTLPDPRGRVLVGAGTLGADTYTVGTAGGNARTTLTTANMPPHDHNVSVATHTNHDHTWTATSGGTSSNGGHNHAFTTGGGGSHSHGGSTTTSGDHAGHMNFPITVASGAGASDVMVGPVNRGNHTHSITTDTEAAHTHSGGTGTITDHNHFVTVTGDVVAASAGAHAVTESTIGSASAVDPRQPWAAINVAIWT